MNQKEKISLVNELVERIKEVNSFFLLDMRGMRVQEVYALRKNLKKNNDHLQVVKNTLLKRSFHLGGIENLGAALQGPTAVVLSGKDPVETAKALADFAKEHENLKFKMGFVEGKPIPASKISELAKIPSKPQLLSELVGTLEGPISGLVYTLEGIIREFVMVVQAIVDKQQAPAEEPAPVPAE